MSKVPIGWLHGCFFFIYRRVTVTTVDDGICSASVTVDVFFLESLWMMFFLVSLWMFFSSVTVDDVFLVSLWMFFF